MIRRVGFGNQESLETIKPHLILMGIKSLLMFFICIGFTKSSKKVPILVRIFSAERLKCFSLGHR